jgi:hypothetical protein
MSEWQPPEGHPISLEKAKELLSGELARRYRDILRKCCAPIFWYRRCWSKLSIVDSGTVTFVRTPTQLLGLTAAHVLRGYRSDATREYAAVRIFDAPVNDLDARIICLPSKGEVDIASFAVDDSLLKATGKEIVPLGWPPYPPQEGRGILLAGYPGQERVIESDSVNFGLFTAIVIAKTVSEKQITWLIEPEWQLETAEIPAPPPGYNLGGASGGPLITLLETDHHVTSYTLGGIIAEHPDYDQGDFSIERVIATRADLVTSSGQIMGVRSKEPLVR